MAKKSFEAPIRPGEIVINGRNFRKFINPTVDGEVKKCGTIPRDYNLRPKGYLGALAPEWDLPLVPEGEWSDRLEQQVKDKAQLSNIRDTGMNGQPIPSRDQNGVGYCWCHSGTSCMLVARAAAGEPYADLSAFAVGSIIKSYRDEGGNGIEGVEFAGKRGIPTSEFWPQQKRDKQYDKPATWENAALHKWTEWRELSRNATERKRQVATCLLMGWPCVFDCDWWGHSIMGADLVGISPFKTRIWNSWGDKWSENGMGILEASKALPDEGVACIVTTPSQK